MDFGAHIVDLTNYAMILNAKCVIKDHLRATPNLYTGVTKILLVHVWYVSIQTKEPFLTAMCVRMYSQLR